MKTSKILLLMLGSLLYVSCVNDSQVNATFLPINFQMYVDDRGNIEDKDNDGFTVLEDIDDNGPNVPVRQ